MVRISGIWFLLLYIIGAPGCLWIPATAAVLVATRDSEKDSEPDLPALVLTADLPEDVVEGTIRFRVTLVGPASAGTNGLEFSYQDENGVLHAVRSSPKVYLAESALAEVGPEWEIPAGLTEDSRIV